MAQKTREDLLPVVLGGDIGAYALGREFHEAYGVRSVYINTGYIPTTIFVNSEGRIVGETYVGGKSYKEWAGIVEKLLEENPRVEKNTDEPSDGKGATEDGGR